MSKNWRSAIKVFKVIWNLTYTVLSIVLAGASDKRLAPRYSSLKAFHLHEEELISDAEYMKSLGKD